MEGVLRHPTCQRQLVKWPWIGGDIWRSPQNRNPILFEASFSLAIHLRADATPRSWKLSPPQPLLWQSSHLPPLLSPTSLLSLSFLPLELSAFPALPKLVIIYLFPFQYFSLLSSAVIIVSDTRFLSLFFFFFYYQRTTMISISNLIPTARASFLSLAIKLSPRWNLWSWYLFFPSFTALFF